MRDGKRRAGLHHDILRGDTARPEDRHLAFFDGDHIAEVRMQEIADADMLRISDVNRLSVYTRHLTGDEYGTRNQLIWDGAHAYDHVSVKDPR